MRRQEAFFGGRQAHAEFLYQICVQVVFGLELPLEIGFEVAGFSGDRRFHQYLRAPDWITLERQHLARNHPVFLDQVEGVDDAKPARGRATRIVQAGPWRYAARCDRRSTPLSY